MPIQKIKSGRVITLPVENFVGSKGEIFFDEDTGILRLGDGVTPGGHILNYGGGTGTYILVTATTTRLGGIKIGSGLVTAGDGTVSAIVKAHPTLNTHAATSKQKRIQLLLKSSLIHCRVGCKISNMKNL